MAAPTPSWTIATPLARFGLPTSPDSALLLGLLAALLLTTAACAPSASTDPSSSSSGASPQASTTVSYSQPSARQLAADGWPGFRGPSGNGIAGESDVPTSWSDDEHMRWKLELPGAGSSSPVVWGDRVYITAYSGYFVPGQDRGSIDELQRHLLAIDRASGDLIWERKIAAKLPEEESIRDHGFAASTPAVDDQSVYVFFGKSGVFAFDHDGNQQWTASVGEQTHGWGSGASPLLVDDLVVINASVESGRLIALRRDNGEQVWEVGGVRESWNTPIIAQAESGRRELVFAIQGSIWGLDPATGERFWECDTDIGWYMVPSIVANQGIVYCLGGRSGITALAVRLGGSGNVTDSHRLWTSQKGTNVTSPIVSGDYLYWMQDQQGIAYCADLATGEIVYEERLNRAGQVYASAILVGDRIYYVTRDGKTFVVAARPEFELLATNQLSDRGVFDASPAVADDHLFLRSHNYLYCLGQ